MFDLGPVIVTLIVWVLGLAVLYWVIRLAVRHAIEDADHRREQAARQSAPAPARSTGRPPATPRAD